MRRYLLRDTPKIALFMTFSLTIMLILAACGNDVDNDEPETVAAEPTATEEVAEFTPEMMYRVLLSEENTVDSVAYHPDGETIAAGTFMKIHLLQASDGDETGVLETDHSVADLEYSLNGDQLAAGLDVYGVHLIDPEGSAEPLVLHGGNNNYLAFHPDGDQIATANRGADLWIWDVASGDQLDEFVPSESEWALAIAYSPDGDHVALGNWNGDIYLFDGETGDLIHTMENPESFGYAYDLAFSPDGDYIAVAGTRSDRAEVIRIWTVDDGAEHTTIDADSQTRAVAWSADGEQLAFGHSDGVVLVDTESMNVIFEISFDIAEGEQGWNTDLAYSPDGTQLLLSRWDGYIEMWRVQE